MPLPRLGLLFAGLAAVVFADAVRAADLLGSVRSAQTGAYLEAVEVTVVDQPISVRTNREGRFAVPALAPGQYQLRIFYPGSREETLAVTVTAAPSAPVEVSLRPVDDDREVVQLGRFVVAGEREGYAASVARQKAADHIQNVLSMDTYGTIADGNIGNFLQRVAGVTANKDAGDVVGVMVRGMPPELNAVQMDGVRLAAADSGINQGDRSVRIDQLPSEFIKEIEIIKANLPEQWADALGGTVNLVTKSAFDYKTDVRTYQAGVSVNTFRDNLWEWRPFGTFTYLNAFGPERNAGVALSGSYNESTHPRDWVQVQRLELDDRVTQARLLDDVVRRKRSGLSSKLELRRPDRLQLKFDAALNLYHQTSDRNSYNVGDSGGRRVADYSRRSRAQIESGLAPIAANGQSAGVAPGYTETFTELVNAVYTNQVARGNGDTRSYKFGVGLKKETAAGLKIDASATHNRSESDGSFNSFTATLRGLGMAIDTADSRLEPKFKQTYGPSIAAGSDFSRYAGVLALSLSDTRDEISSAAVNVSQGFLASIPVHLKAGVAWREQYRWSKNWAPRWNLVGADGVAGTVAATGRNDDNMAQFVAPNVGYGLFNNRYAPRDQFDFGAIWNRFQETPGIFAPAATNVVPPPSKATERVQAGYLMANAKFTNLIATVGARYERTEIDSAGSITDPQNPSQTVIARTSDYNRLFPSVLLKYQWTKDLQLRASWTTTCARPSISAIVPTTTVSYSSQVGALGTVTQNNPALRPQFSDNFDLMAEYYFRPSGLVSFGAFRKDITDFITAATGYLGTGTDNGFNGRYAGFFYNTSINIGTARVEGLEFDYNQQLAMLPKPFNRMRVFGNYTYLRTSGSYNGGAAELVNFVPRAYNVGGSFPWRKFELRLAYNFKGAYLVSYAVDAVARSRNSPDRSFDVNLKYNLRPELSFYVDAVNLLNPGTYWYSLDSSRVVKFERTGIRLTVGVTGRF